MTIRSQRAPTVRPEEDEAKQFIAPVQDDADDLEAEQNEDNEVVVDKEELPKE